MRNQERKNENVFSNRNFRLVFLGALVSELGALLYSFAVSFYILEISGNSAFLQGLYLALCGVSLLVFIYDFLHQYPAYHRHDAHRGQG